MKIEECIKKGKENYEESLQRAVAAEVSPGHFSDGQIRQNCSLCAELHMRHNNAAEKYGV